jgi:hypothetical protein
MLAVKPLPTLGFPRLHGSRSLQNAHDCKSLGQAFDALPRHLIGRIRADFSAD